MKKILPLFDNINHLNKNDQHVILPSPNCYDDFRYTLNFLRSYTGSLGTFNSYRRESERLLQWTWHIANKRLNDLKKEDIEAFIRFCQSPPKPWINTKKVPRYKNKGGLRVPNEDWRPYTVTISKSARKQGAQPSIEAYQLSQGAVQEILAILSTFFNFLIAEEYLATNPVSLIRQKSKFIRKQQHNAPVRRLSDNQWRSVWQAAENLASENPELHERTRFIINLLFGLYLRISELTATDRWVPTMNDFSKDSNGFWWFTTVGKGNKQRQIAVSDDVMSALARWRIFLGLPPLPSAADNSPLIPRVRGHGPMSDTAPIRRLVQQCFDLAAMQLRQHGDAEEADSLQAATVHWLRHTGISEDVKHRPREHVRDDAGHSSSATTDRYIDIEHKERYQSAKRKKIITF
ncbi:tyrosine-type recombinase/integrase [Legionella sp. W05-934-2]|jgi:site-specific recombinase XerD|uniref:tyrosine-type recombinase/integrase n=1 Tax=Legionella sp. W05-934-2 TaxID=1198649 RepID=UPI00346251C3